ncbi:MAG: PEGA domain-containing protein [Acidobacteria bacterium]|nr:PEGA domain-containing protein [Acidobacteriota bacterium]
MLTNATAAATLLAFVLLTAQPVRAQGNTWDKVRYNGGTVATKTKPDDWDNQLTITSSDITIELKDGQRLVIDPARVSSISYGQEAHRRVGTMIALGILVAPLALFGLFHKTKKHFIGVDYSTADGKRAGMLLQGHKDNFRAILLALSSVTGQPVAVSPKDRDEVPANVAITEVAQPTEKELKEVDDAAKAATVQRTAGNDEKAGRSTARSEEGVGVDTVPTVVEPPSSSAAPPSAGAPPSGAPPASSAPPETDAPAVSPAPSGVPPSAAPGPSAVPGPPTTTPGPPPAPATIRVDSGDVIGDIYVDDVFVGNTPSSLKLAPGRHVIRVTAKGYAEWTRTIEVTSGSEITLRAGLEAAP